MASLLTDPLFESSGVGRPPNKNFYHFTVTKSDIIWRWWKISLRAVDRFSKPGELKESHQDFLDNTWLQMALWEHPPQYNGNKGESESEHIHLNLNLKSFPLAVEDSSHIQLQIVPEELNKHLHVGKEKNTAITRRVQASPKAAEIPTASIHLKGEVSVVFGPGILVYTKALCQGHFDYLDHLSESLLLRIINYLELEDVEQLRRTSHRFKQLCGSEMFWEQAVRRCCNTVSDEVVSLALEMGWRSIFFTSKLQLQKLISRRRLLTDKQQEGQVSDRETDVDRSRDESSEQTQASDSEEEFHHAGIIPDMSHSTGTGTGFDTNSCSDIDPGSSSEAEASSDSSESVPEKLLDDIKRQCSTKHW